MITGNKLAAIGSALVLAAVPAGVSAFATWDRDQELHIDSSVYTQVLTHDYEANETRTSSVGFGDHKVTYFLNFRDSSGGFDFVGAFLYDYSTGRFTTDFYSAASTLQ